MLDVSVNSLVFTEPTVCQSRFPDTWKTSFSSWHYTVLSVPSPALRTAQPGAVTAEPCPPLPVSPAGPSSPPPGRRSRCHPLPVAERRKLGHRGGYMPGRPVCAPRSQDRALPAEDGPLREAGGPWALETPVCWLTLAALCPQHGHGEDSSAWQLAPRQGRAGTAVRRVRPVRSGLSRGPRSQACRALSRWELKPLGPYACTGGGPWATGR